MPHYNNISSAAKHTSIRPILVIAALISLLAFAAARIPAQDQHPIQDIDAQLMSTGVPTIVEEKDPECNIWCPQGLVLEAVRMPECTWTCANPIMKYLGLVPYVIGLIILMWKSWRLWWAKTPVGLRGFLLDLLLTYVGILVVVYCATSLYDKYGSGGNIAI